MPYVGSQFDIEMMKLDLKIKSCESMHNEKFRKCQTEVDMKQNELLRRQQNTSEGLAFLNAQVANINANANKVQNAVSAAKELFQKITSLKDYTLADYMVDLLWVVAGTVVPAAGAALNPIRQWRNADKAFARFVGESFNRTGNYGVDLAKIVRNQSGKTKSIENKTYQDGFDKALEESQAQLDFATNIQKEFLEKIRENKIPLDFDVEKLWNEKGLGEYSKSISLTHNQLAEFILYQALKIYTENKCKFFLNYGFKKKDVFSRRVSENSGNFKGLSEAARKQIYARFGSNWVASSDYPQINSLIDLLIHWKPDIWEQREETEIRSPRGGFI